MKLNYVLFSITFFLSFIASAQLAIEHFEPPTTLESQLNYEFKVKYTTDRNIQIFFEFKKAPDQSFGFKATTVGPGTDQILTIPITVDNPPPAGNDYLIKTYFYENNAIVEGTFTDVKNIEMIINVTEDMVGFDTPPSILFSQTNYSFEIPYQATVPRDVIVELWSSAGKLGEGRAAVLPGAGKVSVPVSVSVAPPVGQGYFYKVFMVPTGETIATATATTADFTGVSVVDFLGEPCEDEVIEKDGLVIIEAEDLDITGTAWQRKTTKIGYTGISYLEWLGGNSFSVPGNGVISAKINITKTGRYRFQWRNRVGFGTNGTEHNDSWLKFPDVPAEDFYGEKSNGSRTYPRGSGLTPNPAGASSAGWFKIYANSLDWNFNASTGDKADGRPVYVEFDTPGVYTLQISGRSTNHLIDRIVLHNSASGATNVNTPKSACSSTLGVADRDLQDFGIYTYPVPAKNVLFIQGLQIGDVATILDIQGRVVSHTLSVKDTGEQSIHVAGLTSGNYFLRVKNKGIKQIIVTN